MPADSEPAEPLAACSSKSNGDAAAFAACWASPTAAGAEKRPTIGFIEARNDEELISAEARRLRAAILRRMRGRGSSESGRSLPPLAANGASAAPPGGARPVAAAPAAHD